MSFVTTTLRDTVVNAPKAGGMVTVKAVFDNDSATNLILDGDGLDGFANGAKLDLLRAWWAFTQGTAAANTGDCKIDFVGASSDVTALFLSVTGHYDGSAGAIKAAATNTTATSSDINFNVYIILSFMKYMLRLF